MSDQRFGGSSSQEDNPYAAPDAASAAPGGGGGDVPARLQGGASVGEVFSATSELFGSAAQSGVLWLVVFIQGLTVVASQAPAIMIQGQNPATLAAGDYGMLMVMYLFLFLVSCLSITLYRPLRRVYFWGPRSVDKPVDELSEALSRYWAVAGYMIAFAAIVFVGILLLLVPGIIAAMALPPGMYLIVSSERLGVGEAVSESWGLFKRNWGSIIAAGLAYFAALVVALIPVYVALFSANMAESVVARAGINFVISIPSMLFYTALMCRIEVDDRTAGRSRSIWEKLPMPG